MQVWMAVRSVEAKNASGGMAGGDGGELARSPGRPTEASARLCACLAGNLALG